MKLNYKRTMFIGFAFMSICAFWQFYDQIIPFIFENTFHVSTFWTNAIMAIDNVLALFMLPLFGSLSDRTHTRLGKRTPYILFGTMVAADALAIMPFAEQMHNFWLFFICLLVLLVAMSTYRSPAVALMPDLTPKPLRSKANAIINLMGALGGIYALAMIMVLCKKETDVGGESHFVIGQSFVGIFIAVAIFMLLTVVLLLLTIHENKLAADLPPEDDEEEETKPTAAAQDGTGAHEKFKSLIFILLSVFLWYMAYNAVTTAFSRYCYAKLDADPSTSSSYLMAATIIATLSYIPLGFLSGKLGRKRTILLGVLLMTVCYGVAFFLTHASLLMYLLFGLVGIGWAAINVNSFPMVVELSSAENVGKYTGYYYTASMAAQIATPLLSGFLIDNLGLGYSVLFPYAVVFSALSFVTMQFVRHGDVKAERRGILESFDAMD